MKRKPRIRKDVPTLWLEKESGILRIVWPDETVERYDAYDSDSWLPSCYLPHEVHRTHYYCGPLFVNKENDP